MPLSSDPFADVGAVTSFLQSRPMLWNAAKQYRRENMPEMNKQQFLSQFVGQMSPASTVQTARDLGYMPTRRSGLARLLQGNTGLSV